MPDLLVNIDVADLEQAIAFYSEAVGLRLERRLGPGASVESEVREFAGERYVVLSDPFGNGFCVLEFGGRDYAEVA